MLVVLKKSWAGVFHRSVRDDAGEVLARYTFSPGDPQNLPGEHVERMKRDFDKGALSLCYLDPAKGKLVLAASPAEIPQAALAPPPPDPKQDKPMPVLATLKEVAGYFGVSEKDVKDWRAAGMPGQRGEWNTAEIQAWIEEQPEA